MSEHLRTLLVKLETISGAFTDWRDSAVANGNEIADLCHLSKEKADSVCVDILLVLAYLHAEYPNPWNQTTIKNLVEVCNHVLTTNTLDLFAVHTFMEALDDFRIEHEEAPKEHLRTQWELANTTLRKLTRETSNCLVIIRRPKP
jgi:hypothetical protein